MYVPKLFLFISTVRCLIMQSVFGIEWKNHGNYAKFVPRDFVLGPFIQGLNDPVHHKEFGLLYLFLSYVSHFIMSLYYEWQC